LILKIYHDFNESTKSVVVEEILVVLGAVGFVAGVVVVVQVESLVVEVQHFVGVVACVGG
jgi:hypothetical protein